MQQGGQQGYGQPNPYGQPQYGQPQYGQPQYQQGYQQPQQNYQQPQQSYQQPQQSYQQPQQSYQQPQQTPYSQAPQSPLASQATQQGAYQNVDAGQEFKKEKRFDAITPQYNDVWATILFFAVCFGAVGIIAMVGNTDEEWNDDPPYLSGTEEDDDMVTYQSNMITAMTCTFALTIFFPFMWLIIMRLFPGALLWFTLLFQVFVSVSLAIYSVMAMWPPATTFILILFAAINVLIVYLWRKRIPFAREMLRLASMLTGKYKATVFLSFLQIFILLGYLCFLGYAYLRGAQDKEENTMSDVTYAVVTLSIYWAPQVISNVFFTTYAGTFATWYFMSNTENMVANPTAKALSRSTSYSFGSICFGSLLVALINILRAIVDSALRSDGNDNACMCFFKCIAMCIMNLIADLVNYFTRYALITVAIYGQPFIPSAKRTWDLCKRRGVDAIINDSLVGSVLGLGIFIGGIVGAVGAYWIGKACLYMDEPEVVLDMFMLVVFGLFAGLFFTALAMVVVDSAVSTIFVCYAEDPQPLATNQPEIYNLLIEADTRCRGRR